MCGKEKMDYMIDCLLLSAVWVWFDLLPNLDFKAGLRCEPNCNAPEVEKVKESDFSWTLQMELIKKYEPSLWTSRSGAGLAGHLPHLEPEPRCGLGSYPVLEVYQHHPRPSITWWEWMKRRSGWKLKRGKDGY